MVASVTAAALVLLAFAGWTFLFRRPPEGIWPRTWITAGVLSAASLAALALSGDLTSVTGPVSFEPVAAGLVIGGAWLVATHIGHTVLCRIFPGFLEQISDLYSLREGDTVRTMVGPVVAMAVAEELVFRGVVQGALGLAVGIAAYTAVQVVAGKWALTLAALLGGTVWGVLAWWQGGLIAPVLAHVLWTGMLTFVWPLRGCGRRLGAADVAPLAGERSEPDATPCDASPLAPGLSATPEG